MKVKCGWCPVILDPGPPDAPPDALVSHGMCDSCHQKMIESGGTFIGNCPACGKDVYEGQQAKGERKSRMHRTCITDDYQGIRGGQGRTDEEVANHIDAVVVALAVLTGTGIIIAFIQAIL